MMGHLTSDIAMTLQSEVEEVNCTIWVHLYLAYHSIEFNRIYIKTIKS